MLQKDESPEASASPDAGGMERPAAPVSLLRRALRVFGFLAALPFYLLAVAWAAGALHFDLPAPSGLRGAAAVLWGIAAISLPLFLRPRWKALLAMAACFAVILGWWLTIAPRQDRDWKPEFALPAHATVAGNQITIHDLRNFHYRSESDFTPGYETRTYNLDQLRGCDMFLNYWGSELMAHPVVSFDFGEGGYVCFSIETRQEKGEKYSAAGGFYRMFELMYVVSDELDSVRVRTNFREPQDVYLYRLNLSPEEIRERFMEYIDRLNELHARPKWYNALTHNCTTSIRMQRSREKRIPFDWRMIANGHLDEMMYEHGFLDRSRPFAELKQRSRVNERARAVADLSHFSEKIREGL